MPILTPASVLLQIQHSIDHGDLSKAYVYCLWLQRQKFEEELSVAVELLESAGWDSELEDAYWQAQEELLAEFKC